MYQLNSKFSASEADVLLRCLNQLEHCDNGVSNSRNVEPIRSAKAKVLFNSVDTYRRDEIRYMVLALDRMSRSCSKRLGQRISAEETSEVSGLLRTAASTRCKLKKAAAFN